MGYYDESLKVLELVDRHNCCEECINLFPPHAAGTFGDGKIKYSASAIDSWYLLTGGSPEFMRINHCPWCGIYLPLIRIEKGFWRKAFP